MATVCPVFLKKCFSETRACEWHSSNDAWQHYKCAVFRAVSPNILIFWLFDNLYIFTICVSWSYPPSSTLSLLPDIPLPKHITLLLSPKRLEIAWLAKGLLLADPKTYTESQVWCCILAIPALWQWSEVDTWVGWSVSWACVASSRPVRDPVTKTNKKKKKTTKVDSTWAETPEQPHPRSSSGVHVHCQTPISSPAWACTHTSFWWQCLPSADHF